MSFPRNLRSRHALIVAALVVFASTVQAGGLCTLRDPQPEFPLEMQSAITRDNIAKTIKVEKEIFECGQDLREVNIYTEFFEDLSRPGNERPIRIRVITCDRTPSGDLLGCTTYDPGRYEPNGSIIGCEPMPQSDPVVLNAIVTKRHKDRIKTVHVEKDVYICETNESSFTAEREGPIIKDINTFTEILEEVPDTEDVESLRETVTQVTCYKDPMTAHVVGCEIREFDLDGPR